MGDDLMVRVGVDGHDAALARRAREMDFTGRTIRGFVDVPAEQLGDPDALEQWVRDGVQVAESLPRKKPKR